jgi:hypothetical protein
VTPDQKIARLKEFAARKVAEAKKAAPDRQLKLELWPDEVRGVPNAIMPWDVFAESVTEAHKLAQPEEFDFLPRIGENYIQQPIMRRRCSSVV